MTIIHEEKIVPYTNSQMFDLISDMENYANFLPWCSKSEILEKNQDELNVLLEVKKNGIQKSFTTLNRLHKNEMIEIELIDGPFQYFSGFWKFVKAGEKGSKIIFKLEFKFTGIFLDTVLGPMFQQVIGKFMEAFLSKAKELYE